MSWEARIQPGSTIIHQGAYVYTHGATIIHQGEGAYLLVSRKFGSGVLVPERVKEDAGQRTASGSAANVGVLSSAGASGRSEAGTQHAGSQLQP